MLSNNSFLKKKNPIWTYDLIFRHQREEPADKYMCQFAPFLYLNFISYFSSWFLAMSAMVKFLVVTTLTIGISIPVAGISSRVFSISIIGLIFFSLVSVLWSIVGCLIQLFRILKARFFFDFILIVCFLTVCSRSSANHLYYENNTFILHMSAKNTIYLGLAVSAVYLFIVHFSKCWILSNNHDITCIG